MKQKYIELMDRALDAYSLNRINQYFNQVKQEGLTEHGFARLTSNIGILISFGKRKELKPLFSEMMEFCCKIIPNAKAANDFSVREIVCAISVIEKSNAFDKETVCRWKGYLSEINPEKTYSIFACSSNDKVKNWALFTAVSEFFRKQMGLGGTELFIETQIASQMQWLDENGMYMDGESEIHHPLVYDLVPRALFSILLNAGYKGRYYKIIDEKLKQSALLTLKMQSPNGEVAFGGRSNQFLHNEPWLITIYEYEAKRYASEGNDEMAAAFKSAIMRAISITEECLNREPVSHIKNRFSPDSMFGCESYAYFDKYMITVASVLFCAYEICDDSIIVQPVPEIVPSAFATSKHFHKLFLKAHGFGLEFDLNADSHYDATGLGRIHRQGAPSEICLSVPCPSHPNYDIGVTEQKALSMCPGIWDSKEWKFFNETDKVYEIKSYFANSDFTFAELDAEFPNGESVKNEHVVNAEGVSITVSGNGKIAYQLPAFYFDGADYSNIVVEKNRLSVFYKGWECRYTVSGAIEDGKQTSANRNGYYKLYIATANEKLNINIKILNIKGTNKVDT